MGLVQIQVRRRSLRCWDLMLRSLKSVKLIINDALCEQRLWDIRFRGDENFNMCEICKTSQSMQLLRVTYLFS
ncbi:hypothetical protein C5167_013134 [Papaver somniferum]|uniref:Uncharacterized protein n=1 Tax=Papaver somniferum TaxID=3469 RepID=A0A4Y7J3P8_PAPSO|nr:hypothetical protein C5167_013134 [Papaver somniferum]